MAIKYERPKVRKGHGMRLAPVTNGKCKGQSRIAWVGTIQHFLIHIYASHWQWFMEGDKRTDGKKTLSFSYPVRLGKYTTHSYQSPCHSESPLYASCSD